MNEPQATAAGRAAEPTDGLNVVFWPSVYLVGRQEVSYGAVEKFMRDHGVVWETDSEQAAEVLTEMAGRLCYMSFARPRPGGNKAYEERLMSQFHGSVLEHAVWNMVATGVSRNCTHELVRHRAGWGYSQLSTRYVDVSQFGYVLDDLIGGDADCRAAWLNAVKAAQDAYKFIDGRLQDKLRQATLSDAGRLSAFGERTAAPPDMKTTIQKQAREAARQILPGCLETKIFMTFNARAFRHFMEMRAAEGAAWEIRRLANAMWEALRPEAPNLFADFAQRDLPDGTFTLSPKWRKV